MDTVHYKFPSILYICSFYQGSFTTKDVWQCLGTFLLSQLAGAGGLVLAS